MSTSSSPRLARGKVRAELIEGLPSKIRLLLDWDTVCSLTADRRNCIIHHALLRKDEITRPSVGTDKITFIWRGDARIEVVPSPQVLMAVLRNDEAAAGQREWPTGQETLYLPLDSFKVFDLRTAREAHRVSGKTPEQRKAAEEARARWVAANPEKNKQSKREYAERHKKASATKAQRGRFVLT